MGERIARFDWGRTALGPLPRWPATLRIAVDMVLNAPFPSALVWGADLVVIHNEAYQALHPVQQNALGKSFDLLWRDVWGEVGPWVFEALEGRANFVGDKPIRVGFGAQGAQASFVFCYAPVRDDQGVVAGFLHTVIETTAGAELQQAWQEQAQAFGAQIHKYTQEREHLWVLSRDAMVTVTPELVLKDANPTWYRVLGWSEAQVRDHSLLELIHPADRTEVQVAMVDFVHGKSGDTFETRLRHQDGHYRWFRWSARFDGSLLTAVGRDITDDRDEITRQSEALLRNSQRLEAVGQLAGGMAHEMNNLLSGIGGSLELLQRRLHQGRTDRLDDYVDVARDAVQRAMNLTHRLLAFSRSQPLKPVPLDLNRQLTALQPVLLQTLGAEMRLQWQLDIEPWTVCLDLTQFETALINLCSNAREACLETGSVTIRCANERLATAFPNDTGLPPGDYVAVHVEDDGHGMSEVEKGRAFEPFFTSKALGRGAGLGLAMVYGFVRQSGGYVWISSAPAEGARISMLFPRCHHSLPAEPPAPMPVTEQARGQRLLLVDDELNLRELMREYLNECGFDVYQAGDANEALLRFQMDGPFDLVITDIGLPGGFSGRQLAKAMRQLVPAQRVLFITGFVEPAIHAQLLAKPGTALMLKPFEFDGLLSQVLRMLAD
ncbi:hybrid sensor histidine kinase/response regulator [Pseudomonas sp. Teo4]|uniref:hybrid sensor histidine kinase/response regulator n=1 Tax=Pseudomonas sp. Teo4 TaxID=3064528 RepID=UPI002ABAC0B7|nr:ATP-binding protein [Pseudomonas sp. Teo4]MDZ3991614.1 Sensor histidine kinase RcsC [Pseudomonas sp. Teo4]